MRSQLPEWMRNPDPPRMTIGRRLSTWIDGTPPLRAVRQSWWTWRDRTRWAERYPKTTAIVSFVVVAVVASVLVTGVLYLFASLMNQIRTVR